MKNLKTSMLTGMFLLSAAVSAQNTVTKAKRTEDKKAHTYSDLMINMVSTSLNYGKLNNAMNDYKKSSNGIQAGISFQAGVTAHFSLVPELYFIRKGGQIKTNNPLNNEETDLRLRAIELPVLSRFHFGKFYVNAGPSIAYNFSGKQIINDQSAKLSFSNSGNGFKHFDAGVQAGGGVAFPVHQKRIALDIRYVYGLTNISRSNEMYNRAVMISVHFSEAWKTNPLARK